MYAKNTTRDFELIERLQDPQGEASLTQNNNAPRSLRFPPGSLRVLLDDGTYAAGTYGELTVEQVLRVANQTNSNAFSVNGRFKWTQAYLDEEIAKGVELSIKSPALIPYYKKVYQQTALRPTKIIPNDVVGDVLAANAEQRGLFEVEPFSYPKPTSLIRFLMRCIGVAGEEIVLDFFAGSGTTAHAVLDENTSDSGNRRFIVVQLPVPLDPTEKEQKVAADFCDTLHKPRTIAELTKERLRRAGAKLRSENPLFSGDLGFRVFKLDSTNIRAWDPHPTDLTAELQQSLDHLRTDRTDDDIAFEFMLKYGIDLSTPIEERTIAGKRVLSIGAGAVLACLDRRISNEDAEAVALGMVEWWKTLRPHEDDKDLKRAALFRDAAFASDATKLNLVEILKHYGPTKVYSL